MLGYDNLNSKGRRELAFAENALRWATLGLLVLLGCLAVGFAAKAAFSPGSSACIASQESGNGSSPCSCTTTQALFATLTTGMANVQTVIINAVNACCATLGLRFNKVDQSLTNITNLLVNSTTLNLAPDVILKNAIYQYENNNNALPPDAIMAVGPTRIIALANNLAAIYDKATMTRTWFGTLKQLMPPYNGGDGHIIFDERSQRFLLHQWSFQNIGGSITIPGNTTLQAAPADYLLNPTFSLTAQLVVANPITGGTGGVPSLLNNVAGKIVLFKQGGGVFSYDKASIAIANGAVGVIIFGSTPGDAIFGPSDGRPKLSIPVVGVVYETGQVLIGLAGQSVTMASLSSNIYLNDFLFAISKNDSPSTPADFFTYRYAVQNQHIIPDYPKITADENLIYIATQDFPSLNEDQYTLGAHIFAFDKIAMMAGPSSTSISTVAEHFLPLQRFLWPSVLRTPARQQQMPVFFIGRNDDIINATAFRIYHSGIPMMGIAPFSQYIDVPFPTPMHFANQPFEHGGAPQPAPGNRIEDLSGTTCSVIMFGDSIFLTIVHRPTPTRSVVRWFELDVSDFLSSFTIRIKQWGDVNAVAGMSTYMPSIGVNRNGDVALAFTTSGPSQAPIMGYTARLASDPPGTVRAPYQTPVPNNYLYTGNYPFAPQDESERWGDYSAMVADPSNPNRFWAITQTVSQLAFDNDGQFSYGWDMTVVSFEIRFTGPVKVITIEAEASPSVSTSSISRPSATTNPKLRCQNCK